MEKISNAVESSQHCQRNWDLNKSIDPEHLKLFEYILKTAPSKQNVAFYKVHFIFNRSLIEEIFILTKKDPFNLETRYNPQVLANLLIVFEDYLGFDLDNETDEIRTIKYSDKLTRDQIDSLKNTLTQNRDQAIGIAAGQLVLVANYLGYKTGFCKCFQNENIKKTLNINNNVSLLLGIGFENANTPHNLDHLDSNRLIKTLPKIDIPISIIY